MGKKCMLPVETVEISNVEYQPHKIDAPHLTGLMLKVSTWLLESSFLGGRIISSLLHANKYPEILRNTAIPESPMFLPDFPPQEVEVVGKQVDEESSPIARVAAAFDCLPQYTLGKKQKQLDAPFRYRSIRDYAHAYRNSSITPSVVAERLIAAVEESQTRDPPMNFFISFDAEVVRKQAADSTMRFAGGSPLSILDGIFMAVKDEVDCLPYGTRGGTTWFHKVREVKKDAVCVARLRECGVIFIGKTNQHELGSGTTGNNPHYGTTRNPHDPNHYTGGSSAGSAALVASGLCPAALGTDGGGSVRIPSSLCGIFGLKTTHGRTSCEGVLELAWTVEVVSPMAATAEDAILVYAAMLGSRPNDVRMSKPMPPAFPILERSSHDTNGTNILGSLKLGKYTEWFDDVFSPEISNTCDKAIQLLMEKYGIEMKEIILPELEEMRVAHVVTIGSEIANAISPYYEEGRRTDICYEIRSTMAIMRALTSCDYVSAQRLRRRIMYYHMEAFKLVDVIVTPTTAMTAPVIPKSALDVGESNLVLGGNLMRFVVAPNFVGLPAITVPVGQDKEGLPIGLQLIGRPWAEATLLHLASALEELCASFRKRPAVFYDMLHIT